MENDPPPRQFKLKAKEFERVNAPPGAAPPSADHDVFAIRRQLREREQAAGLDDVTEKAPRRSRRTRDFWLCAIAALAIPLAAGNGIAGRLGLMAGGAVGAMLVVALWWIFFHVLNDY